MIRYLLICLPFFALSQQADVLLLGNTKKICFEEHVATKSDSLPQNLDSYSALFIFSNAESTLSKAELSQVKEYLEQGGNVYIGGENWPLQAEINAFTETNFNFACYGNFENKKAEASQQGRLNLEELEDLPAGQTTTAFPLQAEMEVEAWVNDQPLILSALIGKGKLILDGGYSRFYCELKTNQSNALLEQIFRFFEVELNDTD